MYARLRLYVCSFAFIICMLVYNMYAVYNMYVVYNMYARLRLYVCSFAFICMLVYNMLCL